MVDGYDWNRLLIVVASGSYVQPGLWLAAKLWRQWQYIHIFTVIQRFVINPLWREMIGELPLAPAVLPLVNTGGFF